MKNPFCKTTMLLGTGLRSPGRLAALLGLILFSGAEAHLGNENSTDIRVHADSMRIILRTSIPLAWRLLDGNAPLMADAEGQALARPLLIAVAPGLITVTAAGRPMEPTGVDCLFEVENDVAFIFNFKRPAEWPVVVRANYFERLGNLDSGTIAAYDYTASRFARDVAPLAQTTLDQNNPSFSFSLDRPVIATAAQVVPAPPLAQRPPGASGKIPGILFLLAGLAAIAVLAFRRMSER